MEEIKMLPVDCETILSHRVNGLQSFDVILMILRTSLAFLERR